MGVVRPDAGEEDFDAELQSHIDMHTDDNIRAGMSPADARRHALARLGGVTSTRQAQRERRGLPTVSAWLFDLKLGGRMLIKYPGLSIIGGIAMAFAICVGTVIFQVLSLITHPTVPLPQGDRLVQVRNWDVASMSNETRVLHDFQIWRGSVRSIADLGAWRDITSNLIATPGGDAHPIQVAEMTPAGFRVSDGTPLMGRVLTDDDQRADAPPVVVIGHGIWQTRFAGHPDVVGRVVRLGSEQVTVVGVMPEGYEFPVAHDAWTPLRLVNDVAAARSGPALSVFGVLAPGANLESAQTELTTVGQRSAADMPTTHAQLQPHVSPYAMVNSGPNNDEIGIFASIYFFAIVLVTLICSNVALLLFARAATRESEFTVRTALGAGRGRIVAQLFCEALALGGVAAILGVGAAHLALSYWGLPFLQANLGRLPFWYDVTLTPATMAWALGLTVLGSAIAGIIPALKVTRHMSARLRQSTAGSGGLQFGGIWTAVIIVQVAVTVAFPGVVYQEQWTLRHTENFDTGFPTEEYLAARVQLDGAPPATFATRLEELRRRVESEPGVAAVTFVDRLPREGRPQRRVEFAEPVPPVDGAEEYATLARIESGYFDALGAKVQAGRAFTLADVASDAQVAIVDQAFVEELLHGRQPIGQLVRFVKNSATPDAPEQPWMEIVGVVQELGLGAPYRVGRAAGLYLPSSPERLSRVYLMIHLLGDPTTFASTLRAIGTSVDPSLQLLDVQPVDRVTDDIVWVLRLWLRVSLIMTMVAVVLSLSGIYSVLSFIVARRTREIGIRVALGADRRHVIGAIFRRPLTQVSLGVLAGSLLLAFAGSVETEMPGLTGDMTLGQYVILGVYGLVMFGVCLLACIVPTRRALNVEPTVALRMD
jgi:predicted permease